MAQNTSTKFVVTFQHNTIESAFIQYQIDIANLDNMTTLKSLGIDPSQWKTLGTRPYRAPRAKRERKAKATTK